MENKKIYPVRNRVYTLEEIYNVLYLRDSPALGFVYKDIPGCIQDSHITQEELLSVPGLKDSKWVYVRETFEWIPIFQFAAITVDQPCISTYVDLEPYDDKYRLNSELSWWATPKGFPRSQDD